MIPAPGLTLWPGSHLPSFSSYFLCLKIVLVNIPTFQKHRHWAWEVVTYAGICLHSSILVHSSPKPRKAPKKRLRRALGKERFVLSYRYQ